VNDADTVSTIVVGYDGSRSSRNALLRAALIASRTGAGIVAVAARGPEVDPLDEPVPAPGESGEPGDLLDEAARLLADRGVSFSTRSEDGDPTEALIRVAVETGADIIVVGAHGRNFVARTLAGSVPQKLVKSGPCDVFVVR
jgi:nucleotide-binding universal stress UspA family protein